MSNQFKSTAKIVHRLMIGLTEDKRIKEIPLENPIMRKSVEAYLYGTQIVGESTSPQFNIREPLNFISDGLKNTSFANRPEGKLMSSQLGTLMKSLDDFDRNSENLSGDFYQIMTPFITDVLKNTLGLVAANPDAFVGSTPHLRTIQQVIDRLKSLDNRSVQLRKTETYLEDETNAARKTYSSITNQTVPSTRRGETPTPNK